MEWWQKYEKTPSTGVKPAKQVSQRTGGNWWDKYEKGVATPVSPIVQQVQPVPEEEEEEEDRTFFQKIGDLITGKRTDQTEYDEAGNVTELDFVAAGRDRLNKLNAQETLTYTDKRMAELEEKTKPQGFWDRLLNNKAALANFTKYSPILTETIPEAKVAQQIENDKEELRNLQYATKLANEAIEKPEENREFFKGWGKAISDKVSREGTYLVPFFGVGVEAFEAVKLGTAIEKARRGEELTDLEKSYLVLGEAKGLEIEHGIGYAVGAMLTQMPTYIAEFVLTSGVATTTRVGVSKVLTKAIGKTTAKLITRAGGKTLINVAQMTTRAGKLTPAVIGQTANAMLSTSIGAAVQGSINIPQIASGTAINMLPNYGIDDYDSFAITVNNNGDEFSKALVKAWGSQVVEYVSEYSGGLIEKPLALISKATIGKWLAKRGIKNVTNSTWTKIKDMIKWDGIIGEVFEEELAELAQAPIEERPYFSLNTPEGLERLLVETLGITAFGGIARIPPSVIDGINRVRTKSDTPQTPIQDSEIQEAVNKVAEQDKGAETMKMVDVLKQIIEKRQQEAMQPIEEAKPVSQAVFIKSGKSAVEQESIKYVDRAYYHGLAGERLTQFEDTSIIPVARQAFGGEFSITDDFQLAQQHAGKEGKVIEIKLTKDIEIGTSTTKEGLQHDVSDVGEGEFLVAGNYAIKVQTPKIVEEPDEFETRKITKAKQDIKRAIELREKAPVTAEPLSGIKTKANYDKYIKETQEWIDKKVGVKIVPKELQTLTKEAVKSKTAEEFVGLVQGTDKNKVLYKWDIDVNKNFTESGGVKYPTRGWFNIAMDFYNQAVKPEVKEKPPVKEKEAKAVDIATEKLDEYTQEKYGKTFEDSTRTEKTKALEETKSAVRITDLAEIKKYAIPKLEVSKFENEDRGGVLLWQGLEYGYVTDSYSIIYDKKIATKVLTDFTEKRDKKEIKRLEDAGATHVEAIKIIKKSNESYKKEALKANKVDVEAIIPKEAKIKAKVVGVQSTWIPQVIIEGKDQTVVADARYFLHIYKHLGDLQIMLVKNQPSAPISFVDKKGNVKALLMPLRDTASRLALLKEPIKKPTKVVEKAEDKDRILGKMILPAETQREKAKRELLEAEAESVAAQADKPDPIEPRPKTPKVTKSVTRAKKPPTTDVGFKGIFREDVPIELAHLDDLELSAIEFPEMVQLMRDLTGGKVPFVKKYPTAVGMFYCKDSAIGLHPDLFKPENSQILAKVLAHEIGHLIDYLPNKVMARGNLLGRLQSVTKYLKHTFGNLTNQEIKDELIAASKYWSPYADTAKPSYIKYRESPEELYADAISMLLNSSGTLQKIAPKFFDAFFEGLDKKPAVKKSYFDLLALFGGQRADLIDFRREGVRQMFVDADVAAKDLQEQRIKERTKRNNNLFFRFQYELLSNSQGVIELVKKAQKRGVTINDEDNPVFLLNERNYIGGLIKSEFETNVQPIYELLQGDLIEWHTFGEALFYDRIIDGDRSDVANPRGITPEAAQELRNDIDTKLTKSQRETLQYSEELFRSFIKSVAERGYKAGLYTKELYDEMQKNPAYVTFQVVEHIDDYIAASVYKQVGTIKDVRNPADSSLLKMISTLRAIENQKIKQTTIKFIQANFPEEIEKARKDKNGIPIPTRERYKDIVMYRENGKLEGVYVDQYVANAMNNLSIDANFLIINTLKFFNSRLYRPLFVVFNTGFQAFNLMRDFWRFWKNIPNLTILRALKRYGQAMRPAKIRAFGISKHPSKADKEAWKIINQLEHDKILSVTFNDVIMGQRVEDQQIEQIFRKVGITDEKTSYKHPVVRGAVGVLHFIKKMGDLIETLPKVAGYFELKADIPARELGDFIRKNIGSPDFLDRGNITPATNDIFLFSNAIAQAYRADYNIATSPKTRSAFWWKTVGLNIAPKLLMYAALYGLFGDDNRKMMEDVSEYDKANYTIVPLGRDSGSGKTIYLRLPQDEVGRFISAIFWKMINAPVNRKATWKDVTDIFSYTGGQLPSVTPSLEAAKVVGQYLAGQNPYDSFRGRNVLTDDQHQSGGWDALKPLLMWVFQQSGGSIFVKTYSGESPPREESFGQKILKAPFISNVIGRFVRISDYGQTEILRAEMDKIKTEKSKDRLRENRLINSYVSKYQESDKQGIFLRNKLTTELLDDIYGDQELTFKDKKAIKIRVSKKFKIAIQRGHNDPKVSALIGSTSNDEKIAILKVIKMSLTDEDWKVFVGDMRREGIISNILNKRMRKEL